MMMEINRERERERESFYHVVPEELLVLLVTYLAKLHNSRQKR